MLEENPSKYFDNESISLSLHPHFKGVEIFNNQYIV